MASKYIKKLKQMRSRQLITREEYLAYSQVIDQDSRHGFIKYANKQIAEYQWKAHLKRISIPFRLKRFILHDNPIARKIRKAIWVSKQEALA